MSTPETRLLFTCEHGGNHVPPEFRALFAGKRRLVASHRGWDRGALPVARQLSRSMAVPLLYATTTRLLVDLNRSPRNPRVFSEATRELTSEQRARLLDSRHQRHWTRVRTLIAANPGTTIHVAIHSFTPILDSVPRRFSVGILYDPKRLRERRLAITWQRRLREDLPRSQVRRNAPYRGDADGLTAAMRREFSADRYLGLELELNQRAISRVPNRRALVELLENTLRTAIADRR